MKRLLELESLESGVVEEMPNAPRDFFSICFSSLRCRYLSMFEESERLVLT